MWLRHRLSISILILVSIISYAHSLTPRASDLSSFGKVKHRRTRRKHKNVHLDRYKEESHLDFKDISPIRTRGGGDTHISQTYKKTYLDSFKDISPIHHDTTNICVNARGGGDVQVNKPPSIYWAILHNWLYFMSLGMNLINIQFLVREIVDGDAKATPSAKSIALSGKVESVDKLLTFLGIGFLSALSDKFGRKPLM